MPSDKNAAILVFLQTRYVTTNPDITTLIVRYLRENPNSLPDQTSVMKELIIAAG